MTSDTITADGAPASTAAPRARSASDSRGGDDHRGQRRLRQVREDRVEEQQQQHDGAGARRRRSAGSSRSAFSATAVRDALVDTAKPWNRPAAMFAAPMPIISWSGRPSRLRRAAKLAEVAIVSVSETRVMPSAAIDSGPTSPTFVHGTLGVGKPRGSAPTVDTPWADSSSDRRDDGGADDHDQDGRDAGQPRQHDQRDEAGRAPTARRRARSSSCVTNALPRR